jgi:hypothetical protein
LLGAHCPNSILDIICRIRDQPKPGKGGQQETR